MTKEIDSFDERKNTLCQPCIEGKEHKENFSTQCAQRAIQLLEFIHSDICGPMQVGTHSGCTYFITFIDDLRRYC